MRYRSTTSAAVHDLRSSSIAGEPDCGKAVE
jgi:hypothetical protein